MSRPRPARTAEAVRTIGWTTADVAELTGATGATSALFGAAGWTVETGPGEICGVAGFVVDRLLEFFLGVERGFGER